MYCVACDYHGMVGRDESKEYAINMVEERMCKKPEHQKKSGFKAQIQNVDTGEIITWTQFEPDLFSLLESV